MPDFWIVLRRGQSARRCAARARLAARAPRAVARAPADQEAGGGARHRGTGRGETMKIIGGTDKDKEDEARKRGRDARVVGVFGVADVTCDLGS